MQKSSGQKDRTTVHSTSETGGGMSAVNETANVKGEIETGIKLTGTSTSVGNNHNVQGQALPPKTFRMGNLTKSLLAKAQKDSTDCSLSPTTIQRLINPMRFQLGLPNLKATTEESLSSGDNTDTVKENVVSPESQTDEGNTFTRKENTPNTNTNELLLRGQSENKLMLSSEIKYTTECSKSRPDNYSHNIGNEVPRAKEDFKIAARTPNPLVLHSTLREQNVNGRCMYKPIQTGVLNANTPVAPRPLSVCFRPPTSTGKVRPTNPNSNAKKSNSVWKVRSETVDGKVYIILKELGKGGSGQVDLVMEREARQLFALKKVNLIGLDDSSVQECVNEIQLLIELVDTELVIRIYSWEMNPIEKSMKIVMEYGHNDLSVSLKSTITSVVKLKYIWERMLLILESIHSKGIVHADLKPANFVWVGDTLKIIDFGIASRLQSDHTSIATLNPKGTVNFISPETIRPDNTGKTKISPKSDIWSLGCILYIMVYGKSPFQDLTHYVAKINAICNGAIKYPPLPQHLMFTGVDQVLAECFRLDPRMRPTATELLNHTFLKI